MAPLLFVAFRLLTPSGAFVAVMAAFVVSKGWWVVRDLARRGVPVFAFASAASPPGRVLSSVGAKSIRRFGSCFMPMYRLLCDVLRPRPLPPLASGSRPPSAAAGTQASSAAGAPRAGRRPFGVGVHGLYLLHARGRRGRGRARAYRRDGLHP